MINQSNSFQPNSCETKGQEPDLKISKLGIVSRDYNKVRDFSKSLLEVLKKIDDERCDAVLFSLYSLEKDSFNVQTCLKNLRNIKAVMMEEFKFNDDKKRKPIRYIVYHKIKDDWHEYVFYQQFGSLKDPNFKPSFVKDEIPKRLLGNFCILLCGEPSIVKYSPKDHKVHDPYHFTKAIEAIPGKIKIILNPIHDRMTRFEMKLKRKYLSKNNRWVVSVWNKGKANKNGKVLKEKHPAWTVFYNGNDKTKDIEQRLDVSGVEFGILQID